jgi:hydrogenase maturation protein HypF
VLACLLENRQRAEGVLGVAWDGTGYGEDGTIWGGEFILLEGGRASRFARLRPFRLPGGEAAIRDGRRTALALVHAARKGRYGEVAGSLGIESLAPALQHMLEHGLNSPVTTSAGRLFDAVGSLLGLGGVNRFEGQVPLALEAAALRGSPGAHPMTPSVKPIARGGGAAWELDWRPLLDAILLGRSHDEAAADLARSFHQGLADGIAAIAREAGVGTVALSGGCFQNALLLDLTKGLLEASGFHVLVHRELPPNDGSIAAGQALGALLGLTTVSLP